MTNKDIIANRLINQQLAGTEFKDVAGVVSWFGGMQAQDYASVKWALGIRLPGTTEADIEEAINTKKIIRTWPMRGTLHFVAPEDIRWMLSLLAPRIIAASAARYKQLRLTDKTFAKCMAILEDVLQGGNQLIRKELTTAFMAAGIDTEGQRLSHVLQRAGLEQLICFGARRGNEFTYTLLDEWVPKANAKSHKDALTELATRYFQSHGPATAQDFIWWSGLSPADAKAGLFIAQENLAKTELDGKIYWGPKDLPEVKASKSTLLLPAFDEYYLGYSDRGAYIDGDFNKQIISSNGIFNPVVVIGAKVVGVWKRILKKDATVVETSPFKPLTAPQKKTVETASQKYADFIGLKLEK